MITSCDSRHSIVGYDSITGCSILVSYVMRRVIQRVLCFIEETLVLAGVKPCIISYNTAMDACIRGRGMLRAIGLAKELPHHGLKPDETTFATLLVLMFCLTIF